MVKHKVLLWKRYVDDILVIYNQTIENEHVIMLNKLHSYNKKLKFTYEEMSNNTLNYLDVNLYINEQEIITKVHRKSSSNEITINKLSCIHGHKKITHFLI